ncbi:MAG TPA: sulfatase [Flavobacteriaceae bacterium]|jgi:arylsulfatase A-like enzyme|nr:aryl-sulfate sulfohydrolase [Flavobacteriaceae bacterium]MDP7183480.1 sulfatase [Flavobacteriaceae bacterium]HJO70590.1 sulfatase [Flavobacteriaceae bacterium]|tara:strand:+ start:16541 stop:17998 length:1458 start_codon:yes stop_codon:yes gene_type:complete
MKKILILIIISLFISCQTIENKNENPNIVLIVADDLGWTDVSYMGSKYYETPNIDKLSRSGMTFYNGYASAANCAPSRATMLSGRYNNHHGIYTVGASERGSEKTRKIIPIKNETILDLRYFLIPEMLKNEGYVTGHFGKWHLGSQGFFPEQSGFDVNIGGNESGGPGGYFSPYINPNLEDGPIGEYLTDRIGNEVVSFINYNQNETFFAYVPFYSVHSPIQSKKEYQEKYSNKDGDKNHNRPDYAGMIESLDENIGKILNTIEELNLSEKTLIIFTSDNGGIRAISNQFPLRAGKGSYYEGGIKVPLIFSWKGKIIEESESYERVSNIDFFPTIKKIIGHKNKNLHLDGLDLNPIFKGKTLENRTLFYHFPIYLQAYNVHLDNGTDPLFRTRPGSVIIKDNWKLHHYFEDGKIELYNIEEDISESIDLSKTNLEKTKELYHDLNKWREANNAPIPLENNPNYNQKFVDSLNFLIINKNITGRVN